MIGQLLILLQTQRFAELATLVGLGGEPFRLLLCGIRALKPAMSSDLRNAANTYIAQNRNRLAGILTVALNLRMPAYTAFGIGGSTGDMLTDYDIARTFILKNMLQVTGMPIRGFYVEYSNMTPSDRIRAIAKSHCGCESTKDRQINLFSLCGRYNYDKARDTTQPQGTTCALFLRAVLVAAGDTRFTDTMLGQPGAQAHMIHCLGINSESPTFAEGWTPARSSSKVPLPQPGDLYMIRVEKTNTPDSGHVGVVEDSAVYSAGPVNGANWTTIDGGQKKNSSGPGHYSKITPGRPFRKSISSDPSAQPYPWRCDANEMSILIGGERLYRRLIGWVSIAGIEWAFSNGSAPFHSGITER